MPGFCPYWWQTDAGECGIRYLWRSSDLIERGIFVLFALMLAYTVIAILQFSCQYYPARRDVRQLKPDEYSKIRRVHSKLVADWCPGVAMLRGIAAAAPLLGLAGTSYGILASLFHGFGNQKRLVEAALMTSTAGALVATAGGILVAIPAAFSYNFLRARLEGMSDLLPRKSSNKSGLGSFRLAQSLPRRVFH